MITTHYVLFSFLGGASEADASTLSIPERIMVELVSRLEAITTGNGYDYSVNSVQRINRDAETTLQHLTVAVVQGDETRLEEEDFEGNPPVQAYELPIRIHGIVRQTDRPFGTPAVTEDDTLCNWLQSAIRQAIAEDASWWTFGGYAFESALGGAGNWRSTDHGGTTVELFARYRVSELDPFTTRP